MRKLLTFAFLLIIINKNAKHQFNFVLNELLVIHLDRQRLASALRLDSHVAIQVSLSRCMLGVSQTVSFGGFGMVDMMPESLFMSVYQGLLGQRRCSFCQHCAVRIAVFRQVNEMCFPDCESASPVFCKM